MSDEASPRWPLCLRGFMPLASQPKGYHSWSFASTNRYPPRVIGPEVPGTISANIAALARQQTDYNCPSPDWWFGPNNVDETGSGIDGASQWCRQLRVARFFAVSRARSQRLFGRQFSSGWRCWAWNPRERWRNMLVEYILIYGRSFPHPFSPSFRSCAKPPSSSHGSHPQIWWRPLPCYIHSWFWYINPIFFHLSILISGFCLAFRWRPCKILISKPLSQILQFHNMD